LQLFKIVEELKLVESGDLYCLVLLGTQLFTLCFRSLLWDLVVEFCRSVHIIQVVVSQRGLTSLPPLDKSHLLLLLVLLLLVDDTLDLLALLTVVLVLKEQHVCLFNFEVKGILEFVSLL
jgi:hypothetical protein